jgi:hypothetical protein
LALYAGKLAKFLGNENLGGVLRLCLLPACTTAALELKATGSDKGSWQSPVPPRQNSLEDKRRQKEKGPESGAPLCLRPVSPS